MDVFSRATRCSFGAPAAPISRTATPGRNTNSIFNKLLKLPDETLVYPAHDYKGDTVSTIGEEKLFNPRLKVKSIDEYVDLMNNLKLPNPKMMDVAVPANMHVGLHQDEIARKGWAVSAAEAMALCGRPDVAIVDLREKGEREKHGIIPGSLHAPYPNLQDEIGAGGMLHEFAVATGNRVVVLLRFWRTVSDGGAGCPGRRNRERLSY